MRPGPRLLRSLGLLCVFALLVAALPAALLVLVLAVLTLAGLAALEAVRLRGLVVTIERPPVLVLSLGQAQTLPLSLSTNAPWPLRVTLRQVWPPLLDAPSTTRRGLVRPGEVLRLDLPACGVARGHEALAPAHVAAFRWGLVERLLCAGGEAQVKVLPDLRAVGRLHTKLNRYVLRGLGTRNSARLGKGREFDRLREYVKGDEMRDIAWKASARRGKLISREYRLDRSQDVLVCLDRGHRMVARVGALTKLDHAVNAAVLVAYICNRMEDRIGVLSFATDVTRGALGGRGSAHLRRVTDFVASVRGGYLHTDYLRLAVELRRGLKHRTLIVLLTALGEMETQPLLQSVRLLSSQHLPLVVVMQDHELRAAAGLLPADAAELSRTLAAQHLWAGREQAVRELRRLGAMVVEAEPADTGIATMNAYIEIKRRQLL